ncbi:4-(cytidine 5'-diphospho)-2-C-methyl-D-erythritol kinase [Helicobacter pametensis]|uniref:4-(cytidine 5'-diphospho)-2-C-methyl-D-erythritol kinase n=1 Tax=Helicobacter pametensis TaxID=95149 RepID=UPI0004847965|nr:4-(cytidine 5'-diphospho)-2-C-methyl-D-erythritol kinase [Helicobacter pametensis]
MKIFPKLNIFLNVLALQDGMHPLFSRFVLAKGDVYDEMEICFNQEGFQISGNFDCAMEQNLIFHAKEKLKVAFPHLAGELESIHIEVEKKIPCGAGLGGGSANAGAFLLEVGREFGISKEDLMNLAPKIGSDVAFFVSEYESANVSGIGEVIEEFIESNHYQYEIFTPSFSCNTKVVYQAFDSLNLSPQIKLDFLNLSSVELLHRYDLEELNDLYLPACNAYPKLLDVAKELGEGWFFSGSGSSFFRIKR